MMRVLILLVAGCMVVITTSLPAGPVEDQAIEAIEPQAKPESRRKFLSFSERQRQKKKERYRPCDWERRNNCDSCGDETDQEKKQDCKIRDLECIVANIQRCIKSSYRT